MAAAAVSCPQCGSKQIWKDGIRYVREKEVQRYVCRSCGFRFSESTAQFQVKVDVAGEVPESFKSSQNHAESAVLGVDASFKKASDYSPFSFGENIGSHDDSLASRVEKTLNSLRFYNRKCQVRVTETQGAKNLAEVESRTEKQAAGATTKPTEADKKGLIFQFAWWLKKQGYKNSTVFTRVRNLKRLVKLGANIYNPESVKETIARQTWSVSTKANITDAYHTFTRFIGLTWAPPRYREERSFPFIPTEVEIDTLIASCGNKTASFLQTLKETAMRAGEAFSLEWIDVDMERRLINLRRPEKYSNPRIFKVSAKLIDMLNQLPRKSERVFGTTTLGSLRGTFCASRKKTSKKLANPRIHKISFHTIRHWKATMEYHKTKDIMYVQSMLGHKRINNTQIYINLEQAIFSEGGNSEYTSRIAKTVKGARALLEAGFEYVTDMDGFKIFRKRK